jgi:hypothetical protein
LRHLDDRPGGCAAYPGAFRREALPPVRPSLLPKHGQEGEVDADRRGPNRVNEHTLDMRIDRDPRPRPHHHGLVTTGAGNTNAVSSVNHSETALVLPRNCYALPPFGLGESLSQGSDSEAGHSETGHVIIYRQPATDPTDTITVPVRPGSIVVTPATGDGVVGHCFENAFAMLVAIPGFVSPHHNIMP